MRLGMPEWVTTDIGTVFAGAFRHQLERFGFKHVQTSSFDPQSNGAVERLVWLQKDMLALIIAGATHDWATLLPQLRLSKYSGDDRAQDTHPLIWCTRIR